MLYTCNIFTESQPCSPNPCNSGDCTETGGDIISCDCTGTLRRGETCEIGIVKVPPIPVLEGNTVSSMLTIEANPQKKLFINVDIHVAFDFNKQPGIALDKTQLYILPSSRQVDFTIESINIFDGLYILTYIIDGDEGTVYQSIDRSFVLVKSKLEPLSGQDLLELQQLSKGCCRYDLVLPNEVAACPNLSFLSSCSWIENKDREHTTSTHGAVFVDGQVPVSIAGLSITEWMTYFKIEISGHPKCSRCNCDSGATSFSIADVENLLYSRSLLATFVKQTSVMLPNWMSVSIPPTSYNTPNGNAFFHHDFVTFIGSAGDASNIYGCEYIAFPPSSLVYVIQSYTDIDLNIMGSDTPLTYSPSSTDSYPICYALNLCDGQGSDLRVGVPESLNGFILSSFMPLQGFVNNGWSIRFLAISFTEYGFTIDEDTLPQSVWNGTSVVPINGSVYDYKADVSISGSLIGNTLTASIKFSGSLLYQSEITAPSQVMPHTYVTINHCLYIIGPWLCCW